MRLIPFEAAHADTVLSWPQGPSELAAWAALDAPPDASIFTKWHADPDISGHVLLDEGKPVAYGEVWAERDERSVEFARILVAPRHRRRGVGTKLMDMLLAHASGDWVESFWLRVVPDNRPALELYRSLGFERAPEHELAGLNAAQPRRYVWMRKSR